MKKILTLSFIAIACIFTISAFKDLLVKSVVETTATSVLGAKVRMAKFSLSLVKQSITIEGLRVNNPKGFPEGAMIDAPKISVSCDMGALLKKKLVFKNIEINIKNIVIIRDKDKQLNVNALNTAAETKPQEKDKQEEKPAAQMPMRIDVLKLNVGEIIYKDFSKGEVPVVQVYDAGIKDKTYTNITSANQLVSLILSESLKKTAIEGARVYAASAIMGVGFLPAGVAITLLGKDNATQVFKMPFDKTFDASLKAMTSLGTIKNDDRTNGIISANMADKTNITIRISTTADNSTEVSVSAKKFILPKPEIAKGILFEISEKLK